MIYMLGCGMSRQWPLCSQSIYLLLCTSHRHCYEHPVYLTKIRLASCLSPDGRHISTAKRGGYDLYSLDTGIVLHTFGHGLHAGIDKYPTAFLPGGFVFCGATSGGTITLWGVKEGDRLQSVQHPCASKCSMSACRNPDFPQVGVPLHTLAVCSRIHISPYSQDLFL